MPAYGNDARRAKVGRVMGQHSTRCSWQNTRWSLVRVPDQAFADQAGISLERITECSSPAISSLGVSWFLSGVAP